VKLGSDALANPATPKWAPLTIKNVPSARGVWSLEACHSEIMNVVEGEDYIPCRPVLASRAKWSNDEHYQAKQGTTRLTIVSVVHCAPGTSGEIDIQVSKPTFSAVAPPHIIIVVGSV
jgi:hypothetical protein